MTLKTLIASIIAILATVVLFFYLRQDEKTIIRKRFDTILEAVEKPQGEGNIAMAAKHQTLLQLLDDQVTVELQEPSIDQTFSAEEIMSHYVTIRRHCQSLRLKAEGIEIRLDDETHATLTCYGTARFHATMGKEYEEARPAILTFVKRNDKWLLNAAKEHKVFK